MTVYGIQSLTYDPPRAAGAPKTTDPQQQEIDFLQLLIAQISNQTPDQPMDPTAMITQYSQMEASVALAKLGASSTIYQNSSLAATLLNQPVTVKVASTDGQSPDTFLKGKVDGVDFAGDSPQVKVDGTYYPLSTIVHVGED